MGTLAEIAIIDYCLSFTDHGKQKRLFSVSFCSKQIELCRIHFLFAHNKQKSPFSVSSVFLLQNPKPGDLDMKI
jgi:hypothetical protein